MMEAEYCPYCLAALSGESTLLRRIRTDLKHILYLCSTGHAEHRRLRYNAYAAIF